ncbi:sporulation protein YqfD [Thermoclostridium stercorarium]|jgi:similar to stage IV sporulation protein|uniref:Stage IV sporulation protein n=1 Tax=Thermoclostridium stercorarium subsp. leptospartum DSM 9219 TaxID=1346611 RepID=A0A1B1YIJ2_THEST|nr:sporulation protein YqfD [Thermoclostridium stercorarium]ANX00542.1 stage IV sporulation protein [Thermoclostridium stercorarium subsp. leptospartum DSM 9219]UZQ86155.1 sporulation protein YqfD [Thermoclostridium stercorarium]
MFLIRLWHYLKGYVIIIVSGLSVEKFINICTRRQILLWDIERLSPTEVIMKMSIRGFKNARSAARKSRCRVRIKAKKGLPYIIWRYKKRKGFVAGLIVFAVLIYLMTSIIWSVEITGNYNLSRETLMQQLNEMGIFRGATKRSINPKHVADKLMLNNRGLAWVGVEIKGTKLIISVREGIEPPRVVPMDQPCNVVAERDGIVISVRAKNGLEKVKEGDTVKKGQVLISGVMESKNPEAGTRYVHAMGEVLARTWYEVKVDVPEKKINRIRTGHEWNKYSMYFLDFKIRLPSGNNPFELYEKDIVDKAPVIMNHFKFPLGLIIEKHYELKEEEEFLDKEEARRLAEKTAMDKVSEILPADAEIVDRQMEIFTSDGKEYLLVTVECTENIAMQQEIGGN